MINGLYWPIFLGIVTTLLSQKAMFELEEPNLRLFNIRLYVFLPSYLPLHQLHRMFIRKAGKVEAIPYHFDNGILG